jgi:hypothetical protein
MTVAVPTMNGARHLAEAIGSILQQGDAVAEILISDDRSEDDSLEIIRRLGGDRVRISTNSERLGLAGNWNQCVHLCQTDLIAIVHQDDRLRLGHITAHLRGFESPEVGLVASASGVIDEKGEPLPSSVINPGGLGDVDRLLDPGEAFLAMAEVNPLRCSAVSMRVAAHAQAGGFPPLRYVVDWAFWLKVARSWSIAWIATPTVDVRWHSASETHRFAKGTADLEESERILNDNLTWLKSKSTPTATLEHSAKQRLARAYLNRAHVALRGGEGLLGQWCLRRSFALRPAVLFEILADPRLTARMAAVSLVPAAAGRWFKSPS